MALVRIESLCRVRAERCRVILSRAVAEVWLRALIGILRPYCTLVAAQLSSLMDLHGLTRKLLVREVVMGVREGIVLLAIVCSE